jgi:hypothetical protein
MSDSVRSWLDDRRIGTDESYDRPGFALPIKDRRGDGDKGGMNLPSTDAKPRLRILPISLSRPSLVGMRSALIAGFWRARRSSVSRMTFKGAGGAQARKARPVAELIRGSVVPSPIEVMVGNAARCHRITVGPWSPHTERRAVRPDSAERSGSASEARLTKSYWPARTARESPHPVRDRTCPNVPPEQPSRSVGKMSDSSALCRVAFGSHVRVPRGKSDRGVWPFAWSICKAASSD